MGAGLDDPLGRTLAVAAGVVVPAGFGLSTRLDKVNLGAFLKKTGIWAALVTVVLVVDVRHRADRLKARMRWPETHAVERGRVSAPFGDQDSYLVG
ncbi:hypothetical protein [Streptantibioticus ferralitis]|uniref:Uncharacterized protein n=1 Tax=Streptantibioticus ferralitis TaxID=236510 RepID=A0ABT5Z8F6_9ACTN|nr:hypothetical protein [Streptantibioticus ferralitis]MDF2260112.1 hypothetical protein [Streptantibioticus ferralitis]